MIAVGKRQSLIIVKKVEFGVYLSAKEDIDAGRDTPSDRVLLPAKQVPADAKIGDTLSVFLYRDSEDRLIATTKTPALTIGSLAVLPVKQATKIGAFLSWGLEKDLFLPFKEQTAPVKEGDQCLVTLYVDKSGRLCATMKVYHYLRTDSPYHKDDHVEGIVYEISKNFGTFVAVDNCYSALLPKSEPADNIHVGDRIMARVSEVREDGKLSLSLREKAYMQMNTDADKLLLLLKEAGGSLAIGDKSTPEAIRERTGMSKNEFKRAAGNLYKQRQITISADRISLYEQ